MNPSLEIEFFMAAIALAGLLVSSFAFAATARKARDERQREKEVAAEARGTLRQWQRGVDDALAGRKRDVLAIREEVDRENRALREDIERHHGELQMELRGIHKALGELRGSITSGKIASS